MINDKIYGVTQVLEPMKEADLMHVLAMRNDPETRRYAQTDSIISEAEFDAVFRYTDYPKLLFKSVSYLNSEKTEQLTKILGYVEFRNDSDDGIVDIKEWAFFINPEHRNKGWSELMLDMAIDWATEKGYNFIKGYVKPGNDISNHLHRKLGFDVVKDNREGTVYLLKLTG